VLSNIVLDELDKEVELRGHRFVRYADDLIILVRSEEAAKRVQKSITYFIENRMLLKVNRDKSRICHPIELNFLGYLILPDGGLSISQESLDKFKAKLRFITLRSRGISLKQLITELNPILRGWLNYFKLARMKKRLKYTEGWLRHRIRCYRLKLCKRASGTFRFFRSRGLPDFRIWIFVGSGKSWYGRSSMHAAHEAMNVKWFMDIGLFSLTANYSLIFEETAQYESTLSGVRGS
jgi:hypothetical protein